MELTLLKNDYYGIPSELKEKKQWILSKDKIPCNEKGYKINAYDKSNWKLFSELNIQPGFMPSFVFANDYVGMDLDNCFNDDMSLKKWAINALQTVKNCYIEITQSGKGMHLIFKCTDFFKDKKGINIKINKIKGFENENPKDGCEIYSNNRAFVFTGNVYKNYKSIQQDSFCLTNLYKYLTTIDKVNKNTNQNFAKSKDNIFNIINTKVDIMDILSSYNVIVNKNKAICPFHGEKESSLTVYPFTNSYYCFGCQTGGDVIDFVARKEGITQLAAAKHLNNIYHLNLSFEKIIDQDADPDRIPVKWNPFFVLVEWIDEWENKKKGRLSEYFEIHQNIEPEQRPEIKKFNVLAVEQNIEALLDHYNIEVKYNVIKFDYDVFKDKKHAGPLERWIYYIKNASINQGMQITKEHLLDNLCGIAYKNQYNPWHDYLIKAHEYYLTNPDNTIFEKFVDTIVSTTEMKRKYLGKFLLQMIAVGTSSFESDIASDYMIVLKGPQFLGKTAWLRNLLPKELQQDYFLPGRKLELDNKDNLMETVSNLLVECGEIASTFTKTDQETLKNFITSDKDKFRIPYAKTAITQKRHVCLCATTNDFEYLRDLTGTRRYLTIECLAFDWEAKINHDMLWGYMYSLYLSGMSYKFKPDEIEKINQMNSRYLCKPERILILEDSFDLHPDINDPDAKWYTNDEVIKLLGSQQLMNKFTVGKELKKCNVDVRLDKNRKATYFLRKLEN